MNLRVKLKVQFSNCKLCSAGWIQIFLSLPKHITKIYELFRAGSDARLHLKFSPFFLFKYTLKSLLVTSLELWKCGLKDLDWIYSIPVASLNSLTMFLFPQTAFSTWQLIGNFFLVSHPAEFLMTWHMYHVFYNVQGLRNENTSQGQLSLATTFQHI